MTIHTVEILWISTHKNDEAETGWKKLMELHNMYSSQNIIYSDQTMVYEVCKTHSIYGREEKCI